MKTTPGPVIQQRATARKLAFAVGLAAAMLAGDARADSTDLHPGARAVGRAGALLVGDDGGAALLVSPAGIARRDVPRGRIALGLAADHASYLGADPASPEVKNRAGARALPAVSVIRPAGESLVAGFALLVGRGEEITLPAPPFDGAANTIARLYPHRYGGLSLEVSRHVLAAGLAWRGNDWLAVGASVVADHVTVSEQRMISAGDPAGAPLSPSADLLLGLEGNDVFVPGGAAGVLIAPVRVPVEIAASARFRAGASTDDRATLSPTREGTMLIVNEESEATLELPAVLTARAGARYLGARITAEIDAAYTAVLGDEAPGWQADLAIADAAGSQQAAITSVPSALASRDRLTVGGSVDFAAAPGLLWLTAGYAYATATADRARIAPTRVGLATHTLAIGAEAYFDGTTLAIGYSRRFSQAATIAADDTDLAVIAPFADAPIAAAPGEYDTAEDRAAITVEITW